MTKNEFLARYREELIKRYRWAQDDTHKLDNFMAVVRAGLCDGNPTWTGKGETVTVTWQALGGKGTPTRKELRSLRIDNEK